MKSVPAALQTSLSSGATTMAYCWRVTRPDGQVLGFTEHDRDLVYAGTTFAAGSGFTASQIQQSLDLTIDNMNAAGALSSADLTEADILAGRYDDAIVELFWVDWADTSQGLTIAAGNLGEVTRAGLAFSAEFRSIANRLNQKIGTTCERFCAAKLGDSRNARSISHGGRLQGGLYDVPERPASCQRDHRWPASSTYRRRLVHLRHPDLFEWGQCRPRRSTSRRICAQAASISCSALDADAFRRRGWATRPSFSRAAARASPTCQSEIRQRAEFPRVSLYPGGRRGDPLCGAGRPGCFSGGSLFAGT